MGHHPKWFGSKIWCSSYLLIDYLASCQIQSSQKILEVGCGWGLPSVFVKKHFNVDVEASDGDFNVFAYQQLISQKNKVHIPFQDKKIRQFNKHDLSAFDVLMGADICYSTNLADEICRMCQCFCADADKEIILADKGCEPFLKLVERLADELPVTLHVVSIDLPLKADGYVMHIRQ
ncbi:MAG: hypothetical protein OQL06_12170 [Gammaproteobacteria bacterium]|nr:hypothetical protein [Gammaproteobacteria bacterium]